MTARNNLGRSPEGEAQAASFSEVRLLLSPNVDEAREDGDEDNGEEHHSGVTTWARHV